MRKTRTGVGSWPLDAAGAVLVAGGVWGISGALATRDARIDRLTGVLERAVSGDPAPLPRAPRRPGARRTATGRSPV